MAAADYYNTGNTGEPDRPDRHDNFTPVSGLSHSVSSVSAMTNKPLPPPQPTATTAYTVSETSHYNDDLSYAPNHYSQHSIDYNSPGYEHHSTEYYNHSPSPKRDNENPFSENIPLTDTNSYQHGHQHPKPPIAAAPYHPGGVHHHSSQAKPVSFLRRRPWFVYFMTVVNVAVFCGEIARNASLTGSPIMIKPSFNYMIGPSTDVLINMGARFVPCMKAVPGISDAKAASELKYPCPIRTSWAAECSLDQWCGFGMKPVTESNLPNQWWRFITPMFLHAGLIHLLFNMVMQVILGGDMERRIGSVRLAIVYFVSGIFGFTLGGNLGMRGEPSVGASGCLFGIFALVFLDIFYTWKERINPGKDLIFLFLDIVFAFVLGLLPFIDNFAHIGGFISGIALGMVFMNSPNQIRAHITSDPPYTPATAHNPYNTSTGDNSNDMVGFRGFVKQPLGFFKGRRPMWWAWWLVRAGMLTIILVSFIVMMNNFYRDHKQCNWCKYLSCLPVNNWCKEDYYLPIKTQNETVPNPAKLLLRSVGTSMGDLSNFL